jgi:hypothetical protein
LKNIRCLCDSQIRHMNYGPVFSKLKSILYPLFWFCCSGFICEVIGFTSLKETNNFLTRFYVWVRGILALCSGEFALLLATGFPNLRLAMTTFINFQIHQSLSCYYFMPSNLSYWKCYLTNWIKYIFCTVYKCSCRKKLYLNYR